MTKEVFIAGPCVIESAELLDTVAQELVKINKELDVEIIFKASFDKANRTSIHSFRGPGIDNGLKMLGDVKEKYGFEPEIFDIGGGFGVRYIDTDPYLDFDTKVKEIADTIYSECKKYNLNVPAFRMEPGRHIVADAGMTLYTVGTIKKIPGYKNYVSIDGGMTDNPRYALYKANYTCYTANKMNAPLSFKADLVGRCCESGDIIMPNVMFPESIKRDDIVAVATTGAYNYSMASNYNRLPKPAVVMIKDNKDFVVVKRETLDSLIENDL